MLMICQCSKQLLLFLIGILSYGKDEFTDLHICFGTNMFSPNDLSKVNNRKFWFIGKKD